MTKRYIELKGELDGSCECKIIGGNKCIVFGDAKDAVLLLNALEKYKPKSKENQKRKGFLVEQIEHSIKTLKT